jgi:hypothetical protein
MSSGNNRLRRYRSGGGEGREVAGLGFVPQVYEELARRVVVKHGRLDREKFLAYAEECIVFEDDPDGGTKQRAILAAWLDRVLERRKGGGT